MVVQPAVSDERPRFDRDTKATSVCTWWYDSDGTKSCGSLLVDYGLTIGQLSKWNPTFVLDGCDTKSNLPPSRSYCVEAPADQPTAPVATGPTVSSSATGNGIQTPVPVQPGIAKNCNKFVLVKEKDFCGQLANDPHISIEDFLLWNTGVGGPNCPRLWIGTNACIGVVGYIPRLETTATPSLTSGSTSSSLPCTVRPGDGVPTPVNVKPGIPSNCKKFVLARAGDTCTKFAANNGLSPGLFYEWNKGVGGPGCTMLWPGAYQACPNISLEEPQD